jgi:alpha-galactosidase
MHKRYAFSLASLALIIAFTLTMVGINVRSAHALGNGLALTPPMGWNSWNHYEGNINESIIEAAANAVVSSGMKAAGYEYVNTDAGWWTGSRDSKGNITVNLTKWPGGMQAVAAYIHSKGLKAGIYTDAGINGCVGNKQGSYGHYNQDMLQFAKWGFDYVKVDWCGGRDQGLNPATQYAQVRDAISKATTQTGRTMVFSICNWGVSSPWTWGPSTGNLWRTTGDITCYSSTCVQWNNVLSNLDANALHASSAGPGAWNDPDMLEVGNGGMNSTEDQAHFAMWAIEAAPLFAGNNITNMSATTKSILTNSEVIAVDQDAAGIQGKKVYDKSGLQVWVKRLKGTNIYAVALLNRGRSTANITAKWSTVGLTTSGATVRDLIAHVNRGTFTSSYTASVPSHGVVMLKVVGA